MSRYSCHASHRVGLARFTVHDACRRIDLYTVVALKIIDYTEALTESLPTAIGKKGEALLSLRAQSICTASLGRTFQAFWKTLSCIALIHDVSYIVLPLVQQPLAACYGHCTELAVLITVALHCLPAGS